MAWCSIKMPLRALGAVKTMVMIDARRSELKIIFLIHGPQFFIEQTALVQRKFRGMFLRKKYFTDLLKTYSWSFLPAFLGRIKTF
jgi:hypothetical protein